MPVLVHLAPKRRKTTSLTNEDSRVNSGSTTLPRSFSCKHEVILKLDYDLPCVPLKPKIGGGWSGNYIYCVFLIPKAFVRNVTKNELISWVLLPVWRLYDGYHSNAQETFALKPSSLLLASNRLMARGPFTNMVLIWIPAWMRRLVYRVGCNNLFPNFNGCPIAVWEWISIFIRTLLGVWLIIHAGIKVNPCN